MTLFLVNILLAIIWAAITNSFNWFNLLLGFTLVYFGLWLLKAHWGYHSSYFGRIPRVFSLVSLFIWELILSSLRVTRDVLRPGKFRFRSAIIAIPLTTDRDFEITLLANLITLTPGTISLDVSSDKRELFIHAMDAYDAEVLKHEIKSGFETKIMEALR